jgi:hypothetical protein
MKVAAERPANPLPITISFLPTCGRKIMKKNDCPAVNPGSGFYNDERCITPGAVIF